MEVVRDKNDNCIIVCSIENRDPMGVHTGDSITVAPALTLTDKEYQIMRDAAIAVLREIGVETGGSNVQFAINPQDGRMVVIEMNPRVSRSSALASKATGFPIAKVAAKLAVGYTLDELKNDITGGKTPASFAERGGEGDLLLRGGTRGREIGRAEMLLEVPGQRFDDGCAIGFARFDDLRQRRPAERLHAEEAAAEGGAWRSIERGRVGMAEHEGARDRPFARLSRTIEHECVGRIEADGAQELHRRGPPLSGSSQDATVSAPTSARRSGWPPPVRRTRRSPLASMSRRMPRSAGSLSR